MWTVRTPASEGVIIAAAGRNRGFHPISHEDWDYLNRGFTKFFMTISYILTTIRGRHTSPNDLLLRNKLVEWLQH
jgi:hypothetical protein